MNPFDILTACTAGVFLGIIYFGGLKLTVLRLQGARSPVLTLALSFAVRLIVLSAGLLLVGRGRWWLLAACIAGFFVGRALIFRIPICIRAGRSEYPRDSASWR